MFPVSIKGVLFQPVGTVILLLNDRNEWELPGGRIEVGEQPQACLIREFQEELSLLIQVEALLDTYLFEVIPGKHVFIATYGCTLAEPLIPILSREHQEIGLFSVAALPSNLPDGYRQSIWAWHRATPRHTTHPSAPRYSADLRANP